MAIETSIPVTLNGEARELGADESIADLLLEMDLDPSNPRGIAVAVNDEVIRKGAWGSTRLSPGDRVEVITARQGG